MHTVMVMIGGFAMLGICLLVGMFAGNSSAAPVRAAIAFVPLWFIGAGVNMWVGVANAGYTLLEELPIFLVIFGVPAAVAVVVWWKTKRHGRVV